MYPLGGGGNGCGYFCAVYFIAKPHSWPAMPHGVNIFWKKSSLFAIRYDTIVCILTCSKKLTGSQLNPPDGDHFARYRQTDRQTDGRKSDLNSAALTMQRSLKTKYYKQVWRVYGATSKPPPLPQAYGVWFFTVFVVGYRARFVVGPRSKVSCGARRDVCCRSRSPLGSNNRFSDKPIRLPIGCQ